MSNLKEVEAQKADLQKKLLGAETEAEASKAEAKILEEKVKLLEGRLEQTKRLVDSSSTGLQTTQLMKDLDLKRSRRTM